MNDITRTIVEQIGRKAFYMMGAKNCLACDFDDSISWTTMRVASEFREGYQPEAQRGGPLPPHEE